jgi:DNA-binding LacI/PurR family transcriptional regulator
MRKAFAANGKVQDVVRLQDVAQLAGVSLATASRALNGAGGRTVSPEKLERIREAAGQLKYHPNDAAQQLGRSTTQSDRRTYNIGAILDAGTRYSDPFWSTVLDGVAEELVRQQYHLRFTLIRDDLKNDRQRQLLSSLFVDGLLLLGSYTLAHDIANLDRPEHVVLIIGEDRIRWETDLRYDVVTMEKHAAIDQVVEHLVAQGRRRIGYVGPPPGDDRRGVAFINALAHYDVPFNPGLVAESRFSAEDGYRAAAQLFARNGQAIDALVCACDTVAIGVMRAAKERGMRLPVDLAVTGFDDVEIALHVDPPLTTVQVPKYLMGQLAARVLIRRIAGSDLPPIIHTFPTKLVIRGSTVAASSTDGADAGFGS